METFRDANDRIRGSAAVDVEMPEGIPFLCECADERCTDIIRIRREDYDVVRRDARQFVVAHGHAATEPRLRVVAERDGYDVVERHSP